MTFFCLTFVEPSGNVSLTSDFTSEVLYVRSGRRPMYLTSFCTHLSTSRRASPGFFFAPVAEVLLKKYSLVETPESVKRRNSPLHASMMPLTSARMMMPCGSFLASSSVGLIVLPWVGVVHVQAWMLRGGQYSVPCLVVPCSETRCPSASRLRMK